MVTPRTHCLQISMPTILLFCLTNYIWPLRANSTDTLSTKITHKILWKISHSSRIVVMHSVCVRVYWLKFYAFKKRHPFILVRVNCENHGQGYMFYCICSHFRSILGANINNFDFINWFTCMGLVKLDFPIKGSCGQKVLWHCQKKQKQKQFISNKNCIGVVETVG